MLLTEGLYNDPTHKLLHPVFKVVIIAPPYQPGVYQLINIGKQSGNGNKQLQICFKKIAEP